ncbi:hypothetical protein ACB092_12G020800 [Castanea dentata]
MKDVKQLIDICSDIGDLNNFYLIYTNKLRELDEAIVRFCKGRLLCSVPRHPDFTVGLDVPLKVLKTQLLKEKKQLLLPTAPGGCGKTASVTMLGHDKEIIGKFKDNFFFVPVSKILNLMVIVQRLFHHICGQEPEFQRTVDKIGSSPILLILDDVWSGSEFRLEKFKFDMPKYNILVTSRTIFSEFSFTYNLKSLNDEDATTLLRHSASLQDGNSRIPVEIIEKIVRSYGRFPLALEVSGKSLKEKPVEVWRGRARNWSNGHSILMSSPDLLQCLQKSLEFSDDEDILEECFMDLASFPEGHGEDKDQHLFNAHLLSISIDELFLSSWCNIQAPKVEVLILNFQTQNYSLSDCMFKMDKLKVLMITNYGYFPAELRIFQLLKSLPNLKTIRLEKLSIPSLCKAPVLLKSLKKISVFMCNIGLRLVEINIDYCNDLVELLAVLCDVICLKKLSITNYHQLSALPNGIGKLVNLVVLGLGSCTDLSKLLESIRSLHKLCILDIFDCLSIRHLPKDIGELCNLKSSTWNGA